MNLTPPAQVTDRITVLGRSESCVYWVEDNDESILLGGGMSHIVPDLLRQMENLHLQERRLRSICILHAHFDHCGAVPFLKKRWPWAQVVASARAKDLLQRSDIIESIARMNQAAAESAGLGPAAAEMGFAFDRLRVEKTLSEGDVLSCGDLALEVIETPGHSSCSISVYMAAENALFASDAAGLFQNGVFQPTPNSNFDQYQHSLARLAEYDTDVLLLEHFGAFTGEDARSYLPQAIEAAARLRQLVEETYRRTGDVSQCTKEITGLFLQRSTDSFLSDEVRAMVAGQIVRYIARAMQPNGR